MIENIVRSYIKDIEVYKSARDEFTGKAEIYLDANENYTDFTGEGKNRYPDPHSTALREKIEEVLGFRKENTIITNGSDELIDLLIRLFCEPGRDSILIERPTYGEYKVFAGINNVNVIDVPLTDDLDLDTEEIIQTIKDKKPKIVFICSPNNPTARSYDISKIREIADANENITVIDEAYADFDPSFVSSYTLLKENDRIVTLRTFSKYWALASSRLGLGIASEDVIYYLNKIKAPYNVSLSAQRDGIRALEEKGEREAVLKDLIRERGRLSAEMEKFSFVKRVYKSDANFILIKTDDADSLYSYLTQRGIIVRNRSREILLSGALRITVGSKKENDALLEALNEKEKSLVSR